MVQRLRGFSPRLRSSEAEPSSPNLGDPRSAGESREKYEGSSALIWRSKGRGVKEGQESGVVEVRLLGPVKSNPCSVREIS